MFTSYELLWARFLKDEKTDGKEGRGEETKVRKEREEREAERKETKAQFILYFYALIGEGFTLSSHLCQDYKENCSWILL